MTLPSEDQRPDQPAFALFAYGFRPFFWLAGAYAVVSLVAWLWIFTTGMLPLPRQPAMLWHGHEMLFGFVAAAIGGFLLTAVPSWTGSRGFAGTPLVLLAAAWLAGRLAFAAGAVLPSMFVAACDLIFLPALTLLVAPPLLRARNRNTPLLVVLAGLWLTDVVFFYALARGDTLLARTTLLVAIDIVLLLVTVVGGRIVPAFTASGLRADGVAANIRHRGWLDAVVIAAMAAVAVTDMTVPHHPIAAIVAGVAAIVQAARFAGWQSLRTLKLPLVWSLHLAYAWLPLGLAMKAIHLLSGTAWTAHWLHALTIGAAASMVLAVMTRAALGHTGRALVAARSIAVAYVALSLAALVRVFSPALGAVEYRWTVVGAGVLWIAGFALYLGRYTPILMRSRVDGRPG